MTETWTDADWGAPAPAPMPTRDNHTCPLCHVPLVIGRSYRNAFLLDEVCPICELARPYTHWGSAPQEA